MPRFLARLQIEVRGGDGTQPAPPPAPFKLAGFNAEKAEGLDVPFIVQATYTASRDVNATDGLDAHGKAASFAASNAPGLVPAGGRVAGVKVTVEEWPA